MSRLMLCVAAALSIPAPGFAQASGPLQPTGPWVVGYEEGVCLLQRKYGTSERPVTLSIRHVPTMDGVTVFLLDNGPSGAADSVRVGFGGTQSPVKATLATYTGKVQPIRYSEIALKSSELRRAAATSMLSFDAGSALQYTLAVPKLQAALAEVDKCLADELSRWGVSRDDLARTARFPEPSDREDLDTGDFLLASASLKSSGRNVAYVRVDANGRPGECRIAVPSADAQLDQASCDVLGAVRFEPAVDRAGTPVASVYAHAFRWRAAQ